MPVSRFFAFFVIGVISCLPVSVCAQIVGDFVDPMSTLTLPKRNNLNALSARPGNTTNGQRSLMMGPVLEDQSEIVNFPGSGFGGADASATTGQIFGFTASINSNILLADDIVIPPGEKWLIDSIEVFLYQTGSTTTSTINDLRMQITKGSTPGSTNVKFGDLSTNRLNHTGFSGIYRATPATLTNTTRPVMISSVNTPGLELSSGTYWIEYMAGGSLAAGPFTPPRTISTTHISTGNGYQYNAVWIQATELNTGGSNPQVKGIPMVVYGISVEDKAAKVYGVNYNTLQDAVNAVVNDGDEVILLKDVDETSVTIGPKSVVINADGFDCKLNQVNIANGKYLKWIQNNLEITGNINNNSTGILWNNASVTCPSFTNTGIYKGTGTFIGTLNNQNEVQPGN